MHEDLDHSSLSCVLNAWNSLLLSDTGSKSDFGDVHELSNSAEVTLQNASVAGDVELGAITSRHTSRALSAQASRERSEPPARFSPRRALVDEEREPNDQVNGSKILAQLLEVCTDWSSADHPLTLHICLQVYKGQVPRFEQWVQDVMVLQSQKFYGYKSTLVFRPNQNSSESTSLHVLDVRYQGAANLWKWLQSTERAASVSKGQELGLWDTSATLTTVSEGLTSTVADLWCEDGPAEGHGGPMKADGAPAGEPRRAKPELAKWRVVTFNTIMVWFSVLALGWPQGSLSPVMAGLGWPLWLRQLIIVVLATVMVQWLLAPFFQPYAMWFLMQPRPRHWIFHVEPMRTAYEGFWFSRPRSQKGASAERRSRSKRLRARLRGAARAAREGLQQRASGREAAESPPEPERGDCKEDEALGPAASVACIASMAQIAREEQLRSGLSAASSEASSILKRVTDAAENGDATITVILTHHVKPDKFDEFEEACRDLARGAAKFSGDSFLGSTVIRPTRGTSIFTVVFRYRDRASLEAWLHSSERRPLSAAVHAFTQSEPEVRAETHTALDLLLSGHDETAATEEAGETPSPQAPAKFKGMLIVCVGLYIVSLVDTIFLVPLMSAAGIPTVWLFLITSTINTFIHAYTFTAGLSTLLKRWLDMPRPQWHSDFPWLGNSFPVRWVWEGFKREEVIGFMLLGTGLWIGFGFSADIRDPTGNLVGCGLVFP